MVGGFKIIKIQNMNYKKLTSKTYALVQALLNIKKDKGIKFIYVSPELEKEAEQLILKKIENNTAKIDF